MSPLPEGTSQADAEALQLAWNTAHQKVRDARSIAEWRKYQASVFETADSIVLARIVRADVRHDRASQEAHLYGTPVVYLKPLKWLRGEGASRELALATTSRTSCGLMPGYAAMTGKPGDVHVIYLSGDVLDQEHVLSVMAVEGLDDPGTLALLTASAQ